MIERMVIGLYLTWFLVSILCQVSSAVRRVVSKWDIVRICPSWQLFGFPTRWDFDVLRRYSRPDGSVTEWAKALPAPRHSPAPLLWNPGFVLDKITLDLANSTLALGDENARRKAPRSFRYAAFLSWLNANPPVADVTAVQFIVFAGRAFDLEFRKTVVFLSDFHRIE